MPLKPLNARETPHLLTGAELRNGARSSPFAGGLQPERPPSLKQGNTKKRFVFLIAFCDSADASIISAAHGVCQSKKRPKDRLFARKVRKILPHEQFLFSFSVKYAIISVTSKSAAIFDLKQRRRYR